jgi:RHH-type proline utilization regulon transcriptional repressor/proline dehydrogenase/delta 1-pyrroline-5-carboxylate dehydrogenase
VLRYRARGRVLCIARALEGEAPDGLREALVLQLATCLATGNRVLFGADGSRAVLAGLPAPVLARADWADVDREAGNAVARGPSFEAVLLRAGDAAFASLRGELAAADGPRIAILREPAPGAGYDVTRLLCEQVVSTNTAAAGGNAGLMTLAPG